MPARRLRQRVRHSAMRAAPGPVSAPPGFALVEPPELHPFGALLRVRKGSARFVCKRLSPRVIGDAVARADLANEAALLRALGGRGAPALVDHGEDACGPYVVVEELSWKPLAELSPSASMVAAARSTFGALAEVHGARDARGPLGLVHADVSPANVLVSPDGALAKLVDFGLSAWRERPPIPHAAFRGTARYAAPEVARGEAFDVRADLFALAASLLHVVSGEAPRAGASLPALLVLAGEAPLDAWAGRAAQALPRPLADVLTQCVAFDPALRPGSAREVLRDT